MDYFFEFRSVKHLVEVVFVSWLVHSSINCVVPDWLYSSELLPLIRNGVQQKGQCWFQVRLCCWHCSWEGKCPYQSKGYSLWKVAGFLNPSESSSLEMVLIGEKVSLIFSYSFVIWLHLIDICVNTYACIVNNLVWCVDLYWRGERFMFLCGSDLYICFSRSLKRDKYMRCPISQFSPSLLIKSRSQSHKIEYPVILVALMASSSKR
jgi:hypothetical protein